MKMDEDMILARKLKAIANFENAGELLMKQLQSSLIFLLGDWTSNDDYDFRVYSGDEAGVFMVTRDIPGTTGGTSWT